MNNPIALSDFINSLRKMVFDDDALADCYSVFVEVGEKHLPIKEIKITEDYKIVLKVSGDDFKNK